LLQKERKDLEGNLEKNSHQKNQSPSGMTPVRGFFFLFVTTFVALIFDIQGFQNWVETLPVNYFTVRLSEGLLPLSRFSDSVGVSSFGIHIRKSWATRRPELDQATNAEHKEETQITQNFEEESIAEVDSNIDSYIDSETFPEAPIREVASTPPVSAVLVSEVKSSYHIYAAGDSMLGSALQFELKKLIENTDKIEDLSMQIKSGTGLAKPKLFNWQKAIAADLKKKKADIALIFLGTNDFQNIRDGKRVYQFASENWDRIYQERALTLMNSTCQSVPKVIWFSPLRVRSPELDVKMEHLTTVLESAIKKSACGKFINAQSWVASENKFQSYLVIQNKEHKKQTIKVRHSDGIHLSQPGAKVFAERLLEYLIKEKYL
jgi:hypothetical protein